MYNLLYLNNKFVITGTTMDDLEPIKAIPGASFTKVGWGWQADYKAYKMIKISFPDINVTEEVKAWIQSHLRGIAKLKSFKSPDNIELKSPISDKLYPYQRIGTNYMVKAKRAINADDMGLGKTLESIAAVEESGCKKILIVTLNSVKFSWESELIKWGTKPITIVNGDKSKRLKQLANYKEGYLVINYEGVRIHPELAGMEWDAIIADEAHKLKNKDTLHTIAIKRIKSEYAWALTGTPMENAPHELWSILNWLFPKSFSAYWKFIEQYCVINEFEKDERTIRDPVGAISTKEMHELLQPIMIRRLKVDVLPELPEKTYVPITVEMSKEDRRVYKDILKEMVSVLDNGEIIATPTVLTQYTRLKQVCITQHLLTEKREGVSSAKLDALDDLVESSIDDHKIVIWTCFKTALEIVRNNLTDSKYFKDKGYKIVEIHGDITPEERQLAVQRFRNDPSVRICLCTIQAGGTGIDGLQYASDMTIFLDKHPNPQKNLQAEDRQMRIGQKNGLTIYSIINKDSVEEYIEYKLMLKESSFNRIIDGQFIFLDKYMDNIAKRWN